MSDAAPHPTPRRGGPGVLLLQLLAGLLVALAGLTVMVVLPFVLLLTAMGNDGGHGPATWPVYIWVPAVFLAGIYVVISGLGQMDDPRLGRIALLFGIAIVAFFSFPPFWLSGS
jgi:hypothetical protein